MYIHLRKDFGDRVENVSIHDSKTVKIDRLLAAGYEVVDGLDYSVAEPVKELKKDDKPARRTSKKKADNAPD
jgi:hypothetical protein